MDDSTPVDLLIIGGGINGAGIARDAAGRGLSVVLCEKDDLASHTSSASSKLIHGGLRYLEYYEFRLVGKALAEREVLLRAAPHIIWPLRFIMPHVQGLRPGWLIRIGLFLYDHLDFGKRKLLPPSRGVDLRRHEAGPPLDAAIRRGYEYSDCWVQDARLVVLNAMDAATRGAQILTRTRCDNAHREGDLWVAELTGPDGSRRSVKARALVNAAGPWVSRFLDEGLSTRRGHGTRLVKGSHIVVPKLFDHQYAYIFQNPDQRIVFAIPYEGEYTLIGTTDMVYDGDPGTVAIDASEIDYLCETANRYFQRKLVPTDVVHSYSGVRPLLDDQAGNPSAVTRDYLLDLVGGPAPLLSVFGGKLTTYRKLAEEAVDKIAPLLGSNTGAWTEGGHPLPGGDMPAADFEAWLAGFKHRHPWLPPALARRYGREYGTRAETLLGGASNLGDLGMACGDGVYAAEIDYLRRHEWAQTLEDIIWRRTKLGLHISADTRERIQQYLDREPAVRMTG